MALRIIVSNYEVFNIICIYRSPYLSKDNDYKLLQQLNAVPFASDIIIVRDFNLLNDDWVNGLVVSSVNSIRKYFRIQNEYLDLFTTKALYWFIEEDTRFNLVVNRF